MDESFSVIADLMAPPKNQVNLPATGAVPIRKAAIAETGTKTASGMLLRIVLVVLMDFSSGVFFKRENTIIVKVVKVIMKAIGMKEAFIATANPIPEPMKIMFRVFRGCFRLIMDHNNPIVGSPIIIKKISLHQ